ncbi:hypothetical protein [Chelatococcus reniformis]|uniref:Crescentin coiled-coil domain-containing protein n=1 Tax=Chelatococcus reniformis TaxID=1494448 RepID=A0A916U1R3_9HYPH|nr:hypothetical protein [Chelatococcus reniformis]GGC57127.1 hypothetical protein GCM10010994_15060 [Chelatococcus reniformis]
MIGIGQLLNKRTFPQQTVSTPPKERLRLPQQRESGGELVETQVASEVEAVRPAPPPPDATHEAVRSQLADFSQSLGFLTQLKGSASELEQAIGSILDDFERTRIEHAAISKELKAERSHRAGLLRDAAKAQEELQAALQHRLHLEDTVERHQLNARTLESDLSSANEAATLREAKLADVELQLAQEHSAKEQLTEEVASYRERFEASQNALAQMETDLRKETQQTSLLTEELENLKVALDDGGRKLAKRERELSELNNGHKSALARIADLEGTAAQTETAHKNQIKDVSEKLEFFQSQASSLEAKLAATASRAQVAEQLLGQVRDELKQKIDGLAAAERQLLKITLERNALDKRVADLSKERDKTEARWQETNEINNKLAERSHMLVANFNSKERQYDTIQQRLTDMTQELTSARAQIRNNEQRFDARVVELTFQLEQERIARRLAEKSLEVSRQNIEDLRRDLFHARSLRSGSPLSVVPMDDGAAPVVGPTAMPDEEPAETDEPTAPKSVAGPVNTAAE